MCCVNVLAEYMLTNKVLSASNKKLCRRANNSSNLFEQLCKIHMFITIGTTANFVQRAPSYKGTHVVYNATNPSNTSLSSRPTRSYGMWCSSSCPTSSWPLATASTISRACCTSPISNIIISVVSVCPVLVLLSIHPSRHPSIQVPHPVS